MKKAKFSFEFNNKYTRVASFAAIFAVIGVVLLFSVIAATSSVAIEAESGALTSGAITVNNFAGASGNAAVKFMPQSNEQTGVWKRASAPGFIGTGDCGLFGTTSVGVDPARPSDFYAKADCNGIYKSTDYGKNWAGPINITSAGALASEINGCAGGISVARGSGSSPPIIYIACIRNAHNGTGGFARSLDGGVTFTWSDPTIVPGRNDYYAAIVDPYDSNHLLLPGHEMDVIGQSFDGGQTWSSAHMASGMGTGGGTSIAYFVNTGNAATTRNTWLWMAQAECSPDCGHVGTWRTADGGTNWAKVEGNEHQHGGTQFFQPDTSGLTFMAGVYGTQGWGVYRSANYGQTWTRVGLEGSELAVFGTSKNVYAGNSGACGGCDIDPFLQMAPLPGATGWTQITRPVDGTKMGIGPAQAAVSFNGTHSVIVTANWYDGLWRYVEP